MSVTTPSAMSEVEFVKIFGTLYEHSPWLAERTWQRGLTPAHDSLNALAQAFADTFDSASESEQFQVIRAHPDLAGKAALSGELTADSTGEQASAGIDQLSSDEFERFNELNTRYKEKFQFPFIMAVKGSNKHAIMNAFDERLGNDEATEFKRALLEINKIALLRLTELMR